MFPVRRREVVLVVDGVSRDALSAEERAGECLDAENASGMTARPFVAARVVERERSGEQGLATSSRCHSRQRYARRMTARERPMTAGPA